MGQVRIGNNGWLLGPVGRKELLHPDHVVPAAELIAAAAEGPGQREAQMLMELGAGAGERLVLRLRPADAGVEVQHPHLRQPLFQRRIQLPPQPHFPGVAGQIDGQLTAPVISGPTHKSPGVGVALHRAVHLRHQIGVAAHDVPHPSAKLLLRGGGVFEADGGMLNIVAVNFQQTGRIGDTGVPDNDRHGVFLPDNGIDRI